MKKISLFVLFACMFLGLTTFTYASEAPSEATPDMRFRSEYTITDPNYLAQIAAEENLEIPVGYRLISETISVYDCVDDGNNETNFITPRAGYTIKNVTNDGDFYYDGDYDASDYYDGPCEISQEYITTRTAEMDVEAGVSESVVSAKVGFKIGNEFESKKVFKASVPENTQLNVKVYTNYLVKSFDIYSGSKLVGTGKAWKPKGLIFKQKRYAM